MTRDTEICPWLCVVVECFVGEGAVSQTDPLVKQQYERLRGSFEKVGEGDDDRSSCLVGRSCRKMCQ
jgi:hypothetical protein